MNRTSFWYKLSCVLFPERCAICGDVILPNTHYCDACMQADLRIEEPRCLKCGSGKERCKCRNRSHAYDGVLSVFYYDDRVRRYFPQFKRRPHYGAAESFAQDMARLVQEYGWQTDCIVPVPSYYKTERKRGFNPARLLADELGKELQLSVRPLLTKIADTSQQKKLSRAARTGNLLGAFDVTDELSRDVKSVLLVDDIQTTGSTLHECAKMLKLYGVDTVYAVTVCYTC